LFAALFAESEVEWISLQYGSHADLEAQAEAAHAPLFVDRTVDQLVDMDRFAAQVASIDLVITIDNSTAHLAGALGVPVWVLLPFAPRLALAAGSQRQSLVPIDASVPAQARRLALRRAGDPQRAPVREWMASPAESL
jgi:ADP-heptose:LPS heptosyltransferase